MEKTAQRKQKKKKEKKTIFPVWKLGVILRKYHVGVKTHRAVPLKPFLRCPIQCLTCKYYRKTLENIALRSVSRL